MIKSILFAVVIIILFIGIGLTVFTAISYSKKVSDLEHVVTPKRNDYDGYGFVNTVKDIMNSTTKEVIKKKIKKPNATGLILSIALTVAALCTLITVPGSFHQVDTGTVAVVKELGKVVDIRNPGTYFDFYMIRTYDVYDTKVQQDKITTSAYSKDGQTMDLEVFLQYQVQSENIMDIATEYGSLDALQARIETVTVEKTKAVMSSAEAMTIIQNRSQFSNNVSTSVREGISDDYYVNVKDVVLTNIDFTDEFEKAVEDKVIAEQEKQAAITRAEADLEVAKLEAETKAAEAEGNAQALKILAEAEAEAASMKIIELARSLGFPIETTYVYTTTVETTSADGSSYSKTVAESESAVVLPESTTVETTDTSVVTTTVSQTATHYVIEYDADHTKDDLNKLVIQYLEYLAYLEKWDGNLPDVVSGDDALSIIVPNN